MILDAISMVGPGTTFYYEAELWRVRVVLLLSRKEPAEESLLKALELSRAQQARSLELRAAITLAELWRSAADPQRARQLLEQSYASFTEGFDRPDLIAARNLLQLLAKGGKKPARSTRLSA